MSTNADFELYAFWRTAATHRVRIALNMKGLLANERFVDLDKAEQTSPAFLAISPAGVIPALIEDSYPPLTQSMAILEFLEEKVADPPLLPSDLHGRARVRSISAMLVTDTNPLLPPRVKKYLTLHGGFDEAAWHAWQVQWLTSSLESLERRLASESQTGEFCHGDHPTMADICLVSLVFRAQALQIDLDSTPTIRDIVKNCAALDAFARAHPLLQEGAPSR
ncbi:maleylacetoacetate isomerase [Luteibacter sp. OK325]|uniref:maleylacetoacetate isomerase n=1 Tax=Luteibacter sp. OK325 TaxID=2135670 RepID=UPI000D3439D6|nr:maleylacetoacetate isomerase [Luteibacter sp. OK325]PTR34113.1 maleylacetoacetate isomerase [Luteibacter sp. OK325]